MKNVSFSFPTDVGSHNNSYEVRFLPDFFFFFFFFVFENNLDFDDRDSDNHD